MPIDASINEPLKVKRFDKGEMIYDQGSVARYYYEVKSGEVKVVNINEEGKEFVQGVYKAGDCIGVPSLICDKPFPASAYAHSSCEMYIVPKEGFFRLLKQYPDFHLSITRLLGERLLYKAMMLEEVAIEEGEHRLLTLIHYLTKQRGNANRALNITRQQLADMSGLRVETVIRILKKVEEKGLIHSRRRNIIYDPGKEPV
ncbi:MAG TPA: Crp/Fnr family transcriptional regulator [Puia sp.]|jgi:CRP-like cAMP-binding protein|nr:Crp/Fnr family transcriptional regulator [Puia sp.]